LTKRLDGIRNQYSRDLIPLQQQREQLSREITELKAVRDVFLEETAALNARNEELAQLSSVYSRRMETIPETPSRSEKSRQASVTQGVALAPSLSTSTSSSSTVYEDTTDRHMKVPSSNHEMHTPAKNKFKWPGSKVREMVSPPPTNGGGVEFSKGKAHIEHNFQQLSVLRFTRCDHCGDKMWGSQLKCTGMSSFGCFWRSLVDC
jgi:regulator of replication initiation timing